MLSLINSILLCDSSQNFSRVRIHLLHESKTSLASLLGVDCSKFFSVPRMQKLG